MVYFTNQELGNSYHVSARTVRNWIESARAGKLNLSLHTKGERTYIANTSKNIAELERLAEKGKKFRPHRSQKTVTPREEFYKLYTQEQLYDIVSQLEINHEIPRQYNYFGEGADNWDNYATRLATEKTPNSLLYTIDLLANNRDYLNNLLAQYSQINIIDIGVGNSLPVRDLLTYLLEIGKMGRYIGIDISTEMLKIAQANITSWFGGNIVFEGHALDIAHDRFGSLLVDEYLKPNAANTTNLLMFLGGTIANFKKPSTIYENIHDSMGVNDYLIQSQKLDTKSSRRYFDFNPGTSHASLAPNHRLIFDLLNIDESLYDVDMGFDLKLNERYIRVVLKIALSIRFNFENGERTIYFDKGQVLLLWRAHQNDILDVVNQLSDNDFYPLQVSQTKDQEYVLAISRIKRDQAPS